MRSLQSDRACELERNAMEQRLCFKRQPTPFARVLRAAAAVLIRGCLRIYHRFEIIGDDQLRTNRSLVMVANHSSHLDTLCLLSALPLRKLHRAFPAAATDYFCRNLPRLWIARVVNALPFTRTFHVRRSLSMCTEVIGQRGNILILFPEGTRSTTGQIREFKAGIGALVAGRDVTVVPCYLDGAFRAWPKGRRLPRPWKVRLIIGTPRNYVTYRPEKEEISTIASELHSAVEQLAMNYGSN